MPRATRSPRLVEFNPKRNIVPDRLDLRDRPYIPVLHAPPPPEMAPQLKLPVLNQERTNACTGFALASVVNFLLRKHRDPAAPPMSPFMLYSMARRYDEFPGAAGRCRGLRLEPARRHEGVVQARRLPLGSVAPPGNAAAGRDAGGRLVAGRRAAPARRLLPRRHAVSDGHARGPARRRRALRERRLPRGLAQGKGRQEGQGVLDDPAGGGPA